MSLDSRTTEAGADLQRRIADNLNTVRQALDIAAKSAGRDPRTVRLVAVSKTMAPTAIETAWRAGQRDFGENMVQEALPKIEQLSGRDLTWHFIGHLQTNKVKFIPNRFAWVHSVDHLSLAQKLSAACEQSGMRVNVLLQVNVTGDPHKHGVAPDALEGLLQQILSARLGGISARGLMTIGPYAASEAALHACFSQLRQLRDRCREHFGLADFGELSMGMTDDFAIAVAEGATMIRIGTAIFGPRPQAPVRRKE